MQHDDTIEKSETVTERLRGLRQPTVLASPSSHLIALRPFSPTPAVETAALHVPQSQHSFANITLQRKLTVSAPGDQYEQEAERVAVSVVRQLDARAGGEQAQANTQVVPAAQSLVQRSAVSGTPIAPETAQAVESARGGGQALPAQLGRQMGAAFGADFSGLHIHTDQRADTLNRALSARAFTTGQDVFFRQGEYQPNSRVGQELLAHELTHVVQQTGSIQRMVDINFMASVGFLAANTSPRNKLYKKIRERYTEYQKISKDAEKIGKKANKADEHGKLIREEYNLLKLLKQDSKKWLLIHQDQLPDAAKTGDLEALLRGIEKELPDPKFAAIKSENYLEKMVEYKNKANNAYVDQYGSVISDERAHIAALRAQSEKDVSFAKHLLGEFDNPDESFANISPRLEIHIAKLKQKIDMLNKLTPAQRAAIRTYTNHQYKLINPVVAKNQDWFEGSLKGDLFKGDREDPENTLKANKKIGKMAISGLKNLPNWKQDQDIYRGETLTQAEGDHLKAGGKKNYPHFVSVSLGKTVPIGMMNGNATPQRPVKVLWIIKASKNGKNIADLSKVESEKEILFAPNTTFQIVKTPPATKDIGAVKEVLLEEV